MSIKQFLAIFLAAGLFASSGAVFSQDGAAAKKAEATPVFGSQLMTQQERGDYRAKMLNAKTPEEREAVRAEHHKAMVERAKERGVTLPESPPPRGGMGRGAGMGQGGGMRGGY